MPNLSGAARTSATDTPSCLAIVEVLLGKPGSIVRTVEVTFTSAVSCQRQAGTVQPVADRAGRDAEIISGRRHALASLEALHDVVELGGRCHARQEVARPRSGRCPYCVKWLVRRHIFLRRHTP